MDRKGHLPRLPAEFYRGRAFVHWTLTIDQRSAGWLNDTFHCRWESILLHACARYQLVCPIFVLMPDHMHLVWLGLDETGSDQRVAIEFVRKHLRRHLAPADWQHQAHDNVLRDEERERNASQSVANYILENPVRAGLATRWQLYRYLGACVPGYPDLNVRRADYWEVFWRIYSRLVESR